MPTEIFSAELPLEVFTAVLAGLPWFLTFLSADPALQSALLDAAAGKGKTWQVFTLLLPDVIRGGTGLNGATQGGWRVAARSLAQAIACDVYTGDTVERLKPYPLAAGTPRVACIRTGDEISKMLTAIESLAVPPLSDEIPAQPFNLYLLLLPGLVTDSLWLQPQNPGTPSYIVPYNTLIEGLQAGKLYTEDEFLQTVQVVAQKWASFRKREARRNANGTAKR